MEKRRLVSSLSDATFTDGSKQLLYFGEDAGPKAGLFKGMAVILHERGLMQESKLRAQCKDFKCAKSATNCCCRRVLYNQPDFVAVESNLERICKARGFSVLFLPKFHCELNFIEQCWGYAKRIYRQYPTSSKEADLEQNILSALESVLLDSMRRCVNCCNLTFKFSHHSGFQHEPAGSWMHTTKD
jgi:hypothetical protein